MMLTESGSSNDGPLSVFVPPHLHVPVARYVELAVLAEQLGYDRVWASEAQSNDVFSVLTACAAATRHIGLATGIVPVRTRSPALLAESAATVQDFSDGRFALGVGVSSRRIVSDWNGMPWSASIAELRSYVDIVQQLLRGETVSRSDQPYPLVGSRLLLHRPEPPPLYMAALGPKMLALAGEIADGVVFNFATSATVDASLAVVGEAAARTGKPPVGSAIVVRCCLVTNAESERAAVELAQREVMSHVIVPAYQRALAAQGWAVDCDEAMRLWDSGERSAAARALPEDMVRSIVMIGSVPEVREQLGGFRSVGVSEVVVYPVTSERDEAAKLRAFSSMMNALAL
jgi:probable F420-dependent oxidoreductase